MFNFRFTQRPLTQVFTLALLTILGFTACQKDTVTPSDPLQTATDVVLGDRSGNTIVDIALSNPDFSILVAAVVKSGTVGLLSGAQLNGTVFAPTNAAFEQLPAPFNSASSISAISDAATINTLREIIRYHVVQGARKAANLPNGSYPTFKTAFAPQGNLLFVSRSIGGDVFVNGATKVVAADVQASNGVIHVVDKVLFYPTQDMAQVAISNGNFKALVAALQKTNLTNVFMATATNATVFAPTDAAFAKLPEPLNTAANIKGITDPATISTLRSVLLYHVLAGRVFSTDLREGITPGTLLTGKTVTISLTGGAKVKGSGNSTASNIILANVLARNGVIHAIDQVLLP